MSSLPPVHPVERLRRRHTPIIVLAAVLATVLGTIALWMLVSAPLGGGAALPKFTGTNGHADQSTIAVPPSENVFTAANPELRILDRFRAEQATAVARPALYENPELKTLYYPEMAVVIDLHANPELKALYYSRPAAAVDLHVNPELKSLDYPGQFTR